MRVDTYATTRHTDNAFSFYSEGKQGCYRMLIAITPIPNWPGTYNLGFGVWDSITNLVDDQVELNNGDTDRILTTVAMKALEFLQKNPNANLIATGSVTQHRLRVRTRLYQMGINKHLDYLSGKYCIYGLIADKNKKGKIEGEWPNWAGEWKVYEKDTNYDGFLLNLKKQSHLD